MPAAGETDPHAQEHAEDSGVNPSQELSMAPLGGNDPSWAKETIMGA